MFYCVSMTQIDCDLLCIGCGYNLRHAASEGRCSECGIEVARSIDGDQLYRAEKRWLGKLALGMRLMLNAAVVMLVALIVEMFQLPSEIEKWFNFFGGGAFVLLEAAGLWLILSPEKRASGWLIAARAVIIYFLIVVGAEMVWTLSYAMNWGWRQPEWLDWAGQIGLVGMLIGNMSVFLRGRDIARRAFAPSMRWQFLALAIIQVVIVPAVVMQLVLLMRLYWNPLGRGFPEPLQRMIDVIMQGGLMVTVTWGTVFVWLLRRCVVRARKISATGDGAGSVAEPQVQ